MREGRFRIPDDKGGDFCLISLFLQIRKNQVQKLNPIGAVDGQFVAGLVFGLPLTPPPDLAETGVFHDLGQVMGVATGNGHT